MARDCHFAGLGGVPELALTPAHYEQLPSVGFKYSNDIPDLHSYFK